MLSYSGIFTTPATLTVQIKMAVGRLLTVKRQELNPAVDAWAEQLNGYTSAELAQAFNRAETQIRAFPDIADIVEYIERPRFHDALALILDGLRLFGPEWQDTKPWTEGDRWDYTSPEALAKNERLLVPGKVHPAIKAPEIPPRMVSALCIFGNSKGPYEGLQRLRRNHPNCGAGDFDPGQGMRLGEQIERSLYACWLEARP